MKRAGNALLAMAFVAAMTGGAKAQVNEVISYVNFDWFDYSQATCLDRGEDAVNQALAAFGIEDATTRVSDWSVLANTSTLNFWVFCVADHDDLVDPTAQRVLVISSVNSGRADIGGDLRDFLAECMGGACPSGGERIAWNQGANQFDGPVGTQFDLVCPALGNDAMGTVWGTDIYTDDSPICVAAVHAGIISTDGGAVIIEIMAGQKAYAASQQNGVTSQSWGSYSRSYRFIDAVG
jgi:LCCL domain